MTLHERSARLTTTPTFSFSFLRIADGMRSSMARISGPCTLFAALGGASSASRWRSARLSTAFGTVAVPVSGRRPPLPPRHRPAGPRVRLPKSPLPLDRPQDPECTGTHGHDPISRGPGLSDQDLREARQYKHFGGSGVLVVDTRRWGIWRSARLVKALLQGTELKAEGEDTPMEPAAHGHSLRCSSAGPLLDPVRSESGSLRGGSRTLERIRPCREQSAQKNRRQRLGETRSMPSSLTERGRSGT